MKSELAIKRDEWFASPQGKQAASGDILLYTRYQELLDNRLEAAFLAGASATNEIAEELAEKITA